MKRLAALVCCLLLAPGCQRDASSEATCSELPAWDEGGLTIAEKRVQPGDVVEVRTIGPLPRGAVELDDYIFLEEERDPGAWKVTWVGERPGAGLSGDAEMRRTAEFRRPKLEERVLRARVSPTRFIAPPVEENTTFRVCIAVRGKEGLIASTFANLDVDKPSS